MAYISVIETMTKVKRALDNLHSYPGLALEISYTAEGQLLMTMKHNDYHVVCDFLEELYGPDLVPENWNGEI